MAILESCCGSGLAVSSAVLGVYLLIAYIIAFVVELWWIIESSATPPIPAYLLCLGYFILVVFSALLLHGLSLKKTSFLLVWLFLMGILLGPEAGLVLYLSIHYWKVTSLYGLIEVTCWACRLVVNAIGLLCVQSLHSVWREENSVLVRLETLKKGPLPKIQERKLNMTSISSAHRNDGYERKGREEEVKTDSEDRFAPSYFQPIFSDEHYDYNYIDPRYAEGSEFNEFNASSFDPTVIDARLENMPYLTIRKKQIQPAKANEPSLNERGVITRTRSLMDFRNKDSAEVWFERHSTNQGPASQVLLEKHSKFYTKPESATDSFGTKIIKNKNLKILKSLSPFFSKKPVEVNIYRINPPKGLPFSNLDSQLNEVYLKRGMYTFDEKLKKVVYYPPEAFNKSLQFRKRMDSYGSSQSRSSVDTDSEDIRHISDVAL